MSLNERLAAVSARFKDNAPAAIRGPVIEAKTQFAKLFDPSTTIQVGDKLPDFCLTNALGEEVSSADFFSRGPLLVTFYRGSWCPFCDLAVASLQRHLPEFQSKGVTLVAITPELPDYWLSLSEKHDLQYGVHLPLSIDGCVLH
ncbi:thioredoxin-like protein [Aspergillus spectabilis]